VVLPQSISSPLPLPRWQTPLPESVRGSWGPFVADLAADLLGIRLDDWQQRAINRALATDEAGKLVHRSYLISTARQNGKTALVRSLIAWALTAQEGPPWHRIAGVAYDRAQAKLPYDAVLEDLRPLRRRVGSELALTRYLGIRSDMHRRHREYHVFSAEARDALRGETVDLGIFDEVRTQRNYETWAALEPTTTARPQPLILAISTAGDDRSVLLRDWWERGRRIIEGVEIPHGFGMTWYAADDELADLPHDDPRFVTALYQANPSLAEGRIDLQAILSGVANSTGPAMVRGERLNLWTDAADEWLPPGLWNQRQAPQPANLDGTRIVLGVDAVPSWRRFSVGVGIMHDSGTWTGVAGELDAMRLESSTVEPQDAQQLIADLCRKWQPALLCGSGSHPIAPYIAAAGLATSTPVVLMTPRQIRAASQLLRSELIGARLTHGQDDLLYQQVRAARPNAPIEQGDWYLSIRDSLGEIDAIRACAWAAWGAIAPPEPVDVPQVFV
jgi:hypothetical protein